MSTPSIEFSAQAVAPLAMFKAKDDVRYYLNALCVMPAPHGPGCILVATNGHQLGLWYDAEGECSEQTILAFEKPLIAACQQKGGSGRKIKFWNERLALVDSDGNDVFIQAGKPTIEAKYPDIWRIIPTNARLTPGLHGHIATRYLRTIDAAGKIIERQTGNVGVAAYYSVGGDGHGKIVTLFENCGHFVVVTMPERCREEYPNSSPLPLCFTPPVAPCEATANFPHGSMGEEVLQ